MSPQEPALQAFQSFGWSPGFFFRMEVSIAPCWNSGDSLKTSAAARKATVLYRMGSLSEVLVTTGPMPKLTKSTPQSGAKRATQIHLRLTMPAQQWSKGFKYGTHSAMRLRQGPFIQCVAMLNR